MKRFFFTAIALAAVTVSCTKGGLLESPQTYENPISFEPYTGKVPTTKATIVADVNNGFKVIGFETNDQGVISTTATQPYLEDVVKNTDGKWGYSTPAYWPESPLSFVAYGLNNTSDGTSAFGTNLSLASNKQSIDYTVSTDPASQQDLVISKYIVNPEKGKEISVQLYHVLSKISFKLIATGTASTNVAIKNITLNGAFATKGTFNLTKLTQENLTNGSYTTNADAYSTSGTTLKYSLFNSAYTHNGAGTKLPYFLTSTTTAAGTPIYANAEFNASGYKPEEIDLIPGSNQTAENNRYLMILPGQVGNVDSNTKPYIEVLYQLPGIAEQKATMWLTEDRTETGTNRTFLAGKGYEFVFTLSTTAVSFGVNMSDWEDDHANAEKDFPLN